MYINDHIHVYMYMLPVGTTGLMHIKEYAGEVGDWTKAGADLEILHGRWLGGYP